MSDRYSSPDSAPGYSKGRLGGLLDARNQSLLAYGSVPVEENVAVGLHDEVKTMT